MENGGEEKEYLEQVKSALQKEIGRLLKRTKEYSGDSLGMAKYFWDYQGEMDGIEKRMMWREAERLADVGEETGRQLVRMRKLLESPYFSGIDFQEDGEEVMRVRIGRFSFFDRTNTCMIFDWRSPIAGMYYEFERGPAYYETPAFRGEESAGRICGTILAKRQYKISGGKLELELENSGSIRDEILMMTLAQGSDAKMRDIAATIQKEQNALIRCETADILIVQGVAGSGKTSVALHRIAYFLYRYRREISADNFRILSPNSVFVDYISAVLPELGEEKVQSVEMDDVAAKCLGGDIKWERLCLQPERFASNGDGEWLERSLFKASAEFAQRLAKYCEECDRTLFTPIPYAYQEGQVSADFIRRCYERKKNMPVFRRLRETADEMAQEIRSAGRRGGEGTRGPEIFERLKGRLTCQSSLELYESFYESLGRPELFTYRRTGILEAADVFPLIYVKLYLEGGFRTDDVKYFVVDEMQDYTPIQHAVLKKLYPCKKTLLGDFSQRIYPYSGETKQFLESLYPGALRLELNKSYRCTFEIMEYALNIQPCENMELMERHGEAVAAEKCSDAQEERERLLGSAEAFLRRGDGARLGILCRNHRQAAEYEDFLRKRISVPERLHLFTYDSREFFDGVIVTSSALAKGLEFDRVLIPDADDKNYATEYDRGLLYVACTRAMNGLTLLYCGEKSRFLP